MATTKTVSEFMADLDVLTTGKTDHLTVSKQIRFLNRAIVNLRIDIRNNLPSLYNARQAITPSVGNTLDFPSDFDPEVPFLLYHSSDYATSSIVSDYLYRVFQNKLVFETAQSLTDTYYIEYSTEPSRYTTVSETLIESASYRIYEMLQTEVEYLIDVNLYQGQVSAQAQGARDRTAELSHRGQTAQPFNAQSRQN